MARSETQGEIADTNVDNAALAHPAGYRAV